MNPKYINKIIMKDSLDVAQDIWRQSIKFRIDIVHTFSSKNGKEITIQIYNKGEYLSITSKNNIELTLMNILDNLLFSFCSNPKSINTRLLKDIYDI